jgi:hypothetical protein
VRRLTGVRLRQLMRQRSPIDENSQHGKFLGEWLTSLGWTTREGPGPGPWIEPGSTVGWTLMRACQIAAQAEGAKLLRALGWYAPHEYGRCFLGQSCIEPGKWTPEPRGARVAYSVGGRRVSIFSALKIAGIE